MCVSFFIYSSGVPRPCEVTCMKYTTDHRAYGVCQPGGKSSACRFGRLAANRFRPPVWRLTNIINPADSIVPPPTQKGPHDAPRSLSVAMISILYLLLLGVFILVIVRIWRRASLPYPPGPKGYPILGNVLDLTTTVPIWEDITSLANSYGTLSNRSVGDCPETVL